ncbi:MAG: hypothetical protein IJ530_10140 [Treponema sp.]|uniref:relaxase/mobilization nuclease domain-containing protein n=1 Tax=Treponema sp. TaxID=166 RepID=UPI0025CE43FD|nr:hypothetical protein [Treponema sp.]MBQ8680108.1 hypothetical protein [Treponema sp.]
MGRRRIKESAFLCTADPADIRDRAERAERFKIRKKDDMREGRRLWRIFESLFFSTDSEDMYTGTGKGLFSRKQLCVAKMRIGYDKGSHMKFLKEYLTQQNKDDITEKPELFSSEMVDDAFLENYKKNMSGLHFKWIISPENPGVDCMALTRTLVARMELVTGYKFRWIAAVHTNTSHPHAHLLINGTDKNGKTVDCFRKTFLKQTVREMCRQICTELKGCRTLEEIEASKKRLPNANRYCALDARIETYSFLDRNNSDKEFPITVRSQDNIMHGRLCHLERLGLARVRKEGCELYDLRKGWAGNLHTAGRYSSFLKAWKELLSSKRVNLELFDMKGGAPVEGRVTKVFRMNYEESWDNALVVENERLGKAWFIPLYREPSKRLLGADVICSTGGGSVPLLKVIHFSERHEKTPNLG